MDGERAEYKTSALITSSSGHTEGLQQTVKEHAWLVAIELFDPRRLNVYPTNRLMHI